MQLIILLAMLLVVAQCGDKKCRALVMSGGGDRGAYEAAVFIELANLLPQEDISYDVITGVSTGSMNACGLGLFKPEDVIGASEFVFGVWNSISIPNVFKIGSGGILDGIFNKSGILDTDPLLNFVRQQTAGLTINRKVTFAACDTENADYVTNDFNASDILPEEYLLSAVASSSIPFLFPTRKIGGRILMDGGTLWNVDIPSAIRRCEEVVDDQADIIVDIIAWLGYGVTTNIPKEDLKKYNALDHYIRSTELKSFYDSLSKIESAEVLYPHINFRYVVVPSESLSIGNPIPLMFNQKQIDNSFRIGKKDARNAVKLGTRGYLKVALEYRDMLLAGTPVELSDLIEKSISRATDNSVVK